MPSYIAYTVTISPPAPDSASEIWASVSASIGPLQRLFISYATLDPQISPLSHFQANSSLKQAQLIEVQKCWRYSIIYADIPSAPKSLLGGS